MPISAGTGEAEERALARERREGARRVPGQRAAEAAAAAAQAHRHEVVVAGGEPRAGEAQEHAAALDERRRPWRASRGRARRHRRGPGPRPARRGAGATASADAAAALAHLGIGRERPREVVGRRQERLRLVGRAAEDEPDAAALAALVEERDGAGRALAEDLDAGDGVADLDRQRRSAPRSRWRRPRRRSGASASGRFLRSSARTVPASRPFGSARTTLRGELRRRRSRRPASASAGARSALSTVSGAVAGHARQAVDEGLAVDAGDAVADPDDLRVRRRAARKRSIAVEMRAAGPARCGCGFNGAQPLERRGRGSAGCDLGRARRRCATTATTRPSRPAASTRSTRKRHALAPVVRGREAVVDDEQQRRRCRVLPAAGSRPGPPPRGSAAPRWRGAAAAATTACAPASRAPAAGRPGCAAAGSRSARGCGGVIRSSSQIAGSAASAVSTSGAAKVRGRPSIVSRPRRCWRRRRARPSPA